MKGIMTMLLGLQPTAWLSLAAAPTFALMAALSALVDGGAQPMSSMHMSPLSGMVPMYALMSAFHSTPWLRLVARWRCDARVA